MENLVTNGVSVENSGLGIVRCKFPKVLMRALELGLNPNYERDGNYPLRYALKKIGSKMALCLWRHPKTNRQKLDSDGKNAVYLAIEHQRWVFVHECWKTHRELFLARNNDGGTVFHALGAIGITALENLSGKNAEFIFTMQRELYPLGIDFLTPSQNRPNQMLNHPFFKELEVRLNYQKLDDSLAPKSTTKINKMKI